MASFAETRAEFHRHAKDIDSRFARVVSSISNGRATVEARLQARDSFEFLKGETANLLTCARMVSFLTMEKRLKTTLQKLRSQSDANEAAIGTSAAKATGIEKQLLALQPYASRRLAEVFHPFPVVITMRRTAAILDGKGVPLNAAEVSKHTAPPFYKVWFLLNSGGWKLTTSVSQPPTSASKWEGPFRNIPDLLKALEHTVRSELREMASV